jgi:hypothetical protein
LAVVKQQDVVADQVERALDPGGEGLAEPHRLAVRLADGLMTRPGDIDDATVAGLRAHFTDDQLVEMSLKVMKFNIQKVLVALGNHTWMTADDVSSVAWNRDGAFVAADDGVPRTVNPPRSS